MTRRYRLSLRVPLPGRGRPLRLPGGAVLGKGPLARTRDWPFRNEIAVLVLILAAIQLFPRDLLFGVYVRGAVTGATFLLPAIAVILIYRASKFVNFAQLQLGLVAATMFLALLQGQFLLNIARSVCGCVAREPGPFARNVNFVLSAAFTIAVVAFIAWAAYMTLFRRFQRSPRIMLTLVTVFAGQALVGLEDVIQMLFVPGFDDPRTLARVLQRPTTPPGDFEWVIDPVARVTLGNVLVLVCAAVAVVGLTLYLRRSTMGVAIRAASESPSRAQTLGVNVTAVTARVWLLTGVLAAVAGTLAGFGQSIEGTGGGTIPASILSIILAIAVVARFSSLPMAALGAFVFGVLHEAVQFSFSSTTPFDAGLVFLVGGLLLLQRSRETRAEREDASGFEVTREVRPIPRELRTLPQVQAWSRGGVFLLAGLLLALPWVMSSASTTLVSVYALYAIVGLSLLILTGWAGQISLGQFGFAAIGAWVAAVSGLPMFIAVVVAGAAGALASVVVGVPALKLRGLNLAISTLAFAVSARALFIDERYLGDMLPDSLERPSVLGMDLDDIRTFYYFCILVVALCCLAVVGLRRSRFGRVLIALRANEAAGQSFGVNPLRARLTAFAVAGFLSAFAGALFAFHQTDVAPESFTADVSIEMFMFGVIGGLGGLAGPLLGFSYLAVLTLFGDNPLLRYTASGTGALLLMMASPGGLAQLCYDARDAALRRLAVRLRIPVPSLMGDRKAGDAFDRVSLDERRGRGADVDGSTALLYKPDRQWALDRYGAVGGVTERVGRTEQVPTEELVGG